MANDNHASFVKIGFVVTAGFLAIVGTLVYLGGIRDRGDVLLAETYYDNSVSGLSVGSAVNFRGVKIGEVREIAFVGGKYEVSGADNSRIYILMALDRRQLGFTGKASPEEVRRVFRRLVDEFGMRATVAASGITGLSRIECDFNADNPAAREISWTPDNFYIPAKISLLENFSVSATKVMNQINKMDFSTAWSNMSAIVQSLSAMSETTRNLLESRQGELDRILSSVADTASSAKELVERLRDNPSLLIREQTPEPLPETRR